MATKSDLRDRLKRRLGLGVVSDLEKERLGEALNAGIARAYSDGVPGLAHETFVGSIPTEIALATAIAVADSKSLTVTMPGAGTPVVYPRDILQVDVAGTKTEFLVAKGVSLNGTNAVVLNIGIPASAALSGGSASKIIRRSLTLPNSGQVVSVSRLSSGGKARALVYDPMIALRDPFGVGTAHFFEQRYNPNTATSILTLWPAPDDTTDQFIVEQQNSELDLSIDSSALTVPSAVFDAILERALMAYMTWVGTAIPTNAALMTESIRDTADSLKNASNPVQIITKQ